MHKRLLHAFGLALLFSSMSLPMNIQKRYSNDDNKSNSPIGFLIEETPLVPFAFAAASFAAQRNQMKDTATFFRIATLVSAFAMDGMTSEIK